MSKPFQIKEPQQALTAYLQELLLDNEPTALPLTTPAFEEIPATETVKAVETSPPIKTISRPMQDSQALLFDIAGLSLVLPLTELDSIENWPINGLTQLPGQPAHVLGILSSPQQHTRVIDLTTLITSQSSNSEDCRYILLVNNKQLGLAVSAIHRVIILDKENVRWRRETTKTQRPWLAGMLMSPLSSIISLNELLKIVR